MKQYRTEIHGRLVELRAGDLGQEIVLLDGREVSHRAAAWLTGSSHFFDVTDEQGRERHVELRRTDISRLKLGRYRVVVMVDGIERCRLDPLDPAVAPGVCTNCGYMLAGLPIEDGEVRCPECGRHTPSIIVGIAPTPDDPERPPPPDAPEAPGANEPTP